MSNEKGKISRRSLGTAVLFGHHAGKPFVPVVVVNHVTVGAWTGDYGPASTLPNAKQLNIKTCFSPLSTKPHNTRKNGRSKCILSIEIFNMA